MPTPRTELITKNCIVCGQPFQVCPPGQTSRYCRTPYEAKYCSRDCRDRARWRMGTPCAPLTPTQAAYIAGFLDGEGSVIIYNRRQSCSLRVTFSNTKLAALDWIKDVCQVGNIITSHRNSDKHATAYMLLINGQSAVSLLEQLHPYLVIKGEQAKLGIEFQARLKVPTLKANTEWQHQYRDHMQHLNHRGT